MCPGWLGLMTGTRGWGRGYELVVEKGCWLNARQPLKRRGLISRRNRSGDLPGHLECGSRAEVSGDVTILNLPGQWPLAEVPSSVSVVGRGRPVVIAKENQSTLFPGTYGTWTIGKSAEVTLASGRYDVQSVTIDKEAKVYFDGPVTVCVAERFYMGKESLISPVRDSGWKAADFVIHAHGVDAAGGENDEDDEGSAVTLGKNSIMFGRVWSMNGTIEVKKASQVTGSLVGKDVVIEKGSVVVWDTTPTVMDVTPPVLDQSGGGCVNL